MFNIAFMFLVRRRSVVSSADHMLITKALIVCYYLLTLHDKLDFATL